MLVFGWWISHGMVKQLMVSFLCKWHSFQVVALKVGMLNLVAAGWTGVDVCCEYVWVQSGVCLGMCPNVVQCMHLQRGGIVHE